MFWQKILNALMILFLGHASKDPYLIISTLLYFIGLWGIFRKCSIEGWYALIPCAREWKLGAAAGLYCRRGP